MAMDGRYAGNAGAIFGVLRLALLHSCPEYRGERIQ
jgi:hypothetical protein